MRFRRIAVALDDSPHGQAALEAAAGLASMMGAELSGVYVEDENLLRLAALPGSREIIFPMSLQRELDPHFMEHCLKEQGEKARQALADAASRAGVGWTFGVRAGTTLEELLAMCSGVDLLVMGKAGHHRGPRVRLGSTAAGVLRSGSGNLLFIQQGEPRHGPVMLVAGHGPVPPDGLEAAASLTRMIGFPPVVVCLAGNKPAALRLRKKLEVLPELEGAKFRTLRLSESGGLSRVAWEEQAGLVVIPASGQSAETERLAALASEVELPVFIIRQPSSEPELCGSQVAADTPS